MRLSEHFTLEEMTRSQIAERRQIDNTPADDVLKNLIWFCGNVLEPFREEHGPIFVSSGYRSPILNKAIGGSKTSAHMDGLAADHVTVGISLLDEMDWWIEHDDIPWDQVILEFGRWIHTGSHRPKRKCRHQALMTFSGTGYQPYDRAVAEDFLNKQGANP